MKPLRLSYSLLACWERGDIQGAIDTYFHIDKLSSPAMDEGKRIHAEIAEHIKTYNSFPSWFFNYDLNLPECEKEIIVHYNELFDLKGVFDCIDTPNKTLFEFKTGVSDSLEWARTWQLPIYFLIAEIDKIDIDKALLIRHDQKKNQSDFVVVHNTPRLIDKARNIIDSLGIEIHDYFTAQGLI